VPSATDRRLRTKLTTSTQLLPCRRCSAPAGPVVTEPMGRRVVLRGLRVVRRVGLEPTTRGLRVSTSHEAVAGRGTSPADAPLRHWNVHRGQPPLLRPVACLVNKGRSRLGAALLVGKRQNLAGLDRWPGHGAPRLANRTAASRCADLRRLGVALARLLGAAVNVSRAKGRTALTRTARGPVLPVCRRRPPLAARPPRECPSVPTRPMWSRSRKSTAETWPASGPVSPMPSR
jgi:hypothetical protein